ncbi:MAG: hypothetical protein IJS21_01375, partial [Deltaproteobacteria bacterium]|nr:hypothetical protein [Deltaproteobacteria bacterium]
VHKSPLLKKHPQKDDSKKKENSGKGPSSSPLRHAMRHNVRSLPLFVQNMPQSALLSPHPSRTRFLFDKDRAALAEASSKLQHNQHVLAMPCPKNNRKTILCSSVCGHFPCSVSLGACITMQ